MRPKCHSAPMRGRINLDGMQRCDQQYPNQPSYNGAVLADLSATGVSPTKSHLSPSLPSTIIEASEVQAPVRALFLRKLFQSSEGRSKQGSELLNESSSPRSARRIGRTVTL